MLISGISPITSRLFIKRLRTHNFDLIDWRYWHSMYPGSELFNMWHSSMAIEGRSGNVAGIESPAVDAMLEYFIKANRYEELIPVGRALDRIIMSGHYLIPKWCSKKTHVAHWSHLKHKPQDGLYWLSFTTWWIEGSATMSR